MFPLTPLFPPICRPHPQEPDLPPLVHDYLTTSLGSCTGLLQIISQMLEYARFGGVGPAAAGGAAAAAAGQALPEPQLVDAEFDLATLGEELADVLAARVRGADCKGGTRSGVPVWVCRSCLLTGGGNDF